MIPHQSLHTELTNMAASPVAIVSGTLPKLTPAQMASLASGLGRRTGVKVVFDNYATACTDGKTIILPLTSKDSSWIVRGYLDHELGHVRFSDLDLAPRKPPFERSLWNVIEDCRIEKALGDTYPGMATNLSTLVSELLKTKAGVFKVQQDSPPEALICGFCGLTLRTLYLKQHMLANLAIEARNQFLTTFGPELERDLFGIITQIGSAADTAGVVEMVRQIVALLEQHRDAQDDSGSDSNNNSKEEQPGSADLDSQNNPQQSQTIPDDPEHQDSSGQSQTGPDTSGHPNDPEQDPDNQGSSESILDDQDQQDQIHDDYDQPDDPDQSERSQDCHGSSEIVPDSINPSDQQGAQDDADPSIHSSPDPADLDDLTADPDTETQAPGQDSQSQAPNASSLGLTQTPTQEAIAQALESQEEISDFGQQLKSMALKS
ncbi:Cobalamin biosynthesis protein CobT, partial [Desulfonatronum zhilinae]